MRSLTGRAGLLAILGVILLTTTADRLASRDRQSDLDFALTVLLTREYGYTDRRVARWATPITVSVLIGNAKQSDVVAGAVRDLAGAVAPHKIALAESRDADIQVAFASRRVIERALVKRGLRFKKTDFGSLLVEMADWKIWYAIIYIDSALNDIEIRRTVYQELAQALGPMGDSPVYSRSVMYETATDVSRATSLAPVDRKVLRFLYRHLRPGDDEAAVRAAFDRHWDSVPSD